MFKAWLSGAWLAAEKLVFVLFFVDSLFYEIKVLQPLCDWYIVFLWIYEGQYLEMAAFLSTCADECLCARAVICNLSRLRTKVFHSVSCGGKQSSTFFSVDICICGYYHCSAFFREYSFFHCVGASDVQFQITSASSRKDIFLSNQSADLFQICKDRTFSIKRRSFLCKIIRRTEFWL